MPLVSFRSTLTATVLILTLVACTKLGQTLSPGSTSPITTLSTPLVGAAVHVNRANNPANPVTTAQNLQMFGELRATIGRIDLQWGAVEATTGVYDFTGVAAQDALIQAWRAQGIRPVIILDYGNTLYTAAWNDPPRTPTQLAAWANYCAAVAQHYVGTDVIFEVWNEPNLPNYWANGSGPSAVEYVAVLDAATAAIRAVQPTAYIMTGGLSPSGSEPMAFLTYVVNHANMSRIDAIAYHPYTTADWAPWDPSGFNTTDANAAFRPETLISTVDALRTILNNAFLTKDIHATEAGYPLQFVQALSPTRQAVLISRLMLSAMMTDLSSLVLYDLVNDGTDQTDSENTFGLYDFTFVRKPSGDAFALVTSWLKDATSLDRVVTGRVFELTVGRADGSKFRVAWTTDPTPRVYTTTLPGTPSDFGVKDIFGASVTSTLAGQKVTLTFSEATGPIVIPLN